MLRKVFLINSGDVPLGVLSVDENDAVVFYGGAHFVRTAGEVIPFMGQRVAVFRQRHFSVLHTNNLDWEVPTDGRENVKRLIVDVGAAVAQAIRDNHLELDERRHGDLAAHHAVRAIEHALGMQWVQGAEMARRQAQLKM